MVLAVNTAYAFYTDLHPFSTRFGFQMFEFMHYFIAGIPLPQNQIQIILSLFLPPLCFVTGPCFANRAGSCGDKQPAGPWTQINRPPEWSAGADSLPLFKAISFVHKSGKKNHITASLVISLLCFFMLQYMEHAMLCLEEQQDEFDFKYQTFKMEGR